ncbi:alcohol dehydrogenase catalytic domain-containing protein [Nocardia sp. NPDC006630]|uniref:alcohol dehydrogenase catalytic domain-containing protein n=1 Tax=Nocardia sp. NPDC006630 TaxID=3157181 RepID=UPI0033ADC53E
MITVGRTFGRIDHCEGSAYLTRGTVSEPADTSMVVLEPVMVGVCRSDLREITGTRFGRKDFGHEIIGEVVETTADLADLRGMRVLFDPHPTLSARTSGYAQVVQLCGSPDQLRAALVPVPDAMATAVAVFTEPLACAIHAVRHLNEVTDAIGGDLESPIAVVGAGMAGTLIAATLTARGYRCQLFNPSAPRIEFLRQRRALPARVLAVQDDQVSWRRVVLATAVASEPVLTTCTSMLSDAGLLVLFAGTHPGMHLRGIDLDTVRREQQVRTFTAESKDITVAGTYGATRADFTEALSLLMAAPDDDDWSPARCVQRLTREIVPFLRAAAHLNVSAAGGGLGKTLIDVRPDSGLS